MGKTWIKEKAKSLVLKAYLNDAKGREGMQDYLYVLNGYLTSNGANAIKHLKDLEEFEDEIVNMVEQCTKRILVKEYEHYAESIFRAVIFHKVRFIRAIEYDYKTHRSKRHQKKDRKILAKDENETKKDVWQKQLSDFIEYSKYFLNFVKSSFCRRKKQSELLLRTHDDLRQIPTNVRISDNGIFNLSWRIGDYGHLQSEKQTEARRNKEAKIRSEGETYRIGMPWCLNVQQDTADIYNRMKFLQPMRCDKNNVRPGKKTKTSLGEMYTDLKLEDENITPCGIAEYKTYGTTVKKESKGRSCSILSLFGWKETVSKENWTRYEESLTQCLKRVKDIKGSRGHLLSVNYDGEKIYPGLKDGGYVVEPVSDHRASGESGDRAFIKSSDALLRVEIKESKIASICVLLHGSQYKSGEVLHFSLGDIEIPVQAKSCDVNVELYKLDPGDNSDELIIDDGFEHIISDKYDVLSENVNFQEKYDKETKLGTRTLTWTVSKEAAENTLGYIIVLEKAHAKKTLCLDKEAFEKFIYLPGKGRTTLKYNLERHLEERSDYRLGIVSYRERGLPSKFCWIKDIETEARTKCALYMRNNYCTAVNTPEGKLPRYELQAEEITNHLCVKAGEVPKENCDCVKVFQFNKQRVCTKTPKRVLLLVGETGSGKTTLTDRIMNDYYGVKLEDKFRFTVPVDKTSTFYIKGECAKYESDTKHVRVIVLWPLEGSPVQYPLVIIDTPGIGDTEGLEQDKKNCAEISFVLGDIGAKNPLPVRLQGPNNQKKSYVAGLDGTIHGIAMVVRHNISKLSGQCIWVKDQILRMFGNDVVDKLMIMKTFYDGPIDNNALAVEDVFKDIPEERIFNYNNRSLFSKQIDVEEVDEKLKKKEEEIEACKSERKTLSNNDTERMEELVKKIKRLGTEKSNLSNMKLDETCMKMEWARNRENKNRFFSWMEEHSVGTSLRNTKNVLEKRRKLEILCLDAYASVKESHCVLETIMSTIDAINNIKFDADRLEDEKKVLIKVSEMIRKPITDGRYVTVCLDCDFTCHALCQIKLDEDKAHCWCMENRGSENAHCRACPGKCHWRRHTAADFMHVEKTMECTQTLAKIAKEYEIKLTEKNFRKSLLLKLMEKFTGVHTKLSQKMIEIHVILKELDQFGLLTTKTRKPTELKTFIENRIEKEKIAESKGWRSRVEHYKLIRNNFGLMEAAYKMKERENKEELEKWEKELKAELEDALGMQGSANDEETKHNELKKHSSKFKGYVEGVMKIYHDMYMAKKKNGMSSDENYTNGAIEEKVGDEEDARRASQKPYTRKTDKEIIAEAKNVTHANAKKVESKTNKAK